MTTGLIMQTQIYVISMEFLSLRRRRLSWRNEVARSKEKRLFSQVTRHRTNFRPVESSCVSVFRSHHLNCEILIDVRVQPFKILCEHSENIERLRVNEVAGEIFQQIEKLSGTFVNVVIKLKLVQLFSLYTFSSHFRPRDVTREKGIFLITFCQRV